MMPSSLGNVRNKLCRRTIPANDRFPRFCFFEIERFEHGGGMLKFQIRVQGAEALRSARITPRYSVQLPRTSWATGSVIDCGPRKLAGIFTPNDFSTRPSS